MKPSKPRKSPKPTMSTLDAHALRDAVGGDVYMHMPRGSNDRPGG